MKKVVTFGEILERQSPLGKFQLGQTCCREVYYGGSEANVAVSLALLGTEVSHVTKLPENSIGDDALRTLRYYGVDTSHILRGGERLGRYIMEPGFDACSGKCTYDRKHSAIAEAAPEEFNWERIFRDACWFHFSGITPAISDNAALTCLQACQTAQKHGLFVSCDINYRSLLWSKEKASEIMKNLCRYVDVVIVNEEDASILGADLKGEDLMSVSAYEKMADNLFRRFKFQSIASAARIKQKTAVQGVVIRAPEIYRSHDYKINVIDPVGAGDAFAAALIHGMLKGMTNDRLINFATAACALKHNYKGDFNLSSEQDIQTYADKTSAEGIQR